MDDYKRENSDGAHPKPLKAIVMMLIFVSFLISYSVAAKLVTNDGVSIVDMCFVRGTMNLLVSSIGIWCTK